MTEQRLSYRKNLGSIGYLARDDREHGFCVKNLSLSGKAHFKDDQDISKEMSVHVRLHELKLDGYAFPVWTKPADEGDVDAGLQLVNDALSALPTARCSQPLSSRSDAIVRGAGCPNRARPDLWEPRASNRRRLPGLEISYKPFLLEQRAQGARSRMPAFR